MYSTKSTLCGRALYKSVIIIIIIIISSSSSSSSIYFHLYIATLYCYCVISEMDWWIVFYM